jgi:uroporphyrinogen-III synthase
VQKIITNGSRIMEEGQENRLLHEIVRIIGSSFELDDILHQIIDLVTRLVRADGCFLYIHDPSYREMILAASKNPRPKAVGQLRLKVGEGITGWVASQKKPVAISQNAWTDPRFKAFSDLPEDRYEAFLSVPLMLKEKVIGVVNVQHRKPRVYPPHEIKVLATVGRLMAGAIENAWLIQESARKSRMIEELEEDLKTRKVLERAKGLLMLNRNLSEEAAYQWLRQESMSRRKTMREIAEAVLLAEELSRQK